MGTKRYEADGSGTYVNSWTSLPFGDNETALGVGVDATEHHFTGKEHDAESGLDYFKARYYQSQTGRWLLPDWSETPVPVPYASFTNPQSLNLYTYVGNNPVNAVDADGHVQNGQDGSSRTGEGVTQPQACGTQNADAVTSNNSVCVVVQDGTTTPTASPSQAAANNQVNQSNEAPAQQQSTTPPAENTLLAQNDPPPPPNGRANSPAQGQEPGSTVTIPSPDGGSTERTFGPNGKAEKDIDRGHGGEKHGGVPDPHAHDWDWTKPRPRQPGRPLTPEEQSNLKRTAGGVTAGVIIYWIISEATRLFPPRNLIPIP